MIPLIKKLQLKAGARALVLHAPANYGDTLGELPEGVSLALEAAPGTTYDFVQLFVLNSSELADNLSALMPHLRPDSVFWITYPKKKSGIPTDLGMTQRWDELTKYAYDGVTAAAIDERWTALRFKPAAKVKRSESCNDSIPTNTYGTYIDLEKREIRLPEDLLTLLQRHPAALEFFHSLSFTNRKEYVVWILDAKQEKTRLDRLEKTVEKLENRRKNPSEK